MAVVYLVRHGANGLRGCLTTAGIVQMQRAVHTIIRDLEGLGLSTSTIHIEHAENARAQYSAAVFARTHALRAIIVGSREYLSDPLDCEESHRHALAHALATAVEALTAHATVPHVLVASVPHIRAAFAACGCEQRRVVPCGSVLRLQRTNGAIDRIRLTWLSP